MPADRAGGVDGPYACAARGAMLGRLKGRWGETPAAAGLADEGRLVADLTVNAATGTWTLMLSDALGRACLIAAGTDWHAVAAKPPADPIVADETMEQWIHRAHPACCDHRDCLPVSARRAAGGGWIVHWHGAETPYIGEVRASPAGGAWGCGTPTRLRCLFVPGGSV